MGPSNSGTLLGRILCLLVISAVTAVLTSVTAVVYHRAHDPLVIAYWWLGNSALLFCMIAFARGRRFLHLPVAAGRVLAIVPAYDEEPTELEACIRSILNQRGATVDEVHVVDDGSRNRPVQPWCDSRVVWHRKPNGGKRYAQVHVLNQLNPDDWDFVLTVDGDSVLDQDALAHQLRAFSRPSIMATTGMVLVSNESENLLTRLADVNIGTSCVMMRASRSLLGTLETTSGALAVYRARTLFKHKDRYAAAGTYGDDRCLAMYSAMAGEVVGVNEAVVWSSMPTDMRTTYRQRLRWSKSWWCMIPFVLTNMDRFRQMFFPLFGLMQLVIAPITVGFALVSLAISAAHHDIHWAPLVLYASVYLSARYAQVALYMVERPGMPLRRKLTSLLLLTPLEAIYNLVFLNPTKYIALAKLRDHGWGTRNNAHSGAVSSGPDIVPMPPTILPPALPLHAPLEPLALVGQSTRIMPVVQPSRPRGGRRHRPQGAPPLAILAEAAAAHRDAVSDSATTRALDLEAVLRRIGPQR